MNDVDKLVKICADENIEVLSDKDKKRIIVRYDGYEISTNRQIDTSANIQIIEDYLEIIRSERFYNSDEFKQEFNKQLEIAIIATKGGGSGAVAVRDTLLSLYNGSSYKANLSGWYNLDKQNRKALLYILEHHTFNHQMPIDQYLPEYQNDFERMKKEVDNDS